MNCPICNKAGLIDMVSVCPQCNSDLAGFQILKVVSSKHNEVNQKIIEVEKKLHSQSQKNRRMVILWTLVILASLLYIFWNNTRNSNQMNILAEEIKEKQDSLLAINKRLASIQEKDNHVIQTSTFKYVVHEGDYLSKIAKFFYGDILKYKKLAEDNKLKDPSHLAVGDTLLINLNK
jgi:hypothetical protein